MRAGRLTGRPCLVGVRRWAAVVLGGATCALAGTSSALAGTTLVKDKFNADATGWTTTFFGEPPEPSTWSASGNGPGSIYFGVAAQPSPYEFYFSAKPKFLGNQGAAYKGALTFDVYRGATPVDLIVYMHGKGVTLRYNYGGFGFGQWWPVKIPLSKAGWQQVSDSHQVTGAELKAVLKYITALNIDITTSSLDTDRTDFWLDNVKLKSQ